MSAHKPAAVILNPYSNRWKAKERWPEAEAALRRAGVVFELFEMQAPGDGIRVA